MSKTSDKTDYQIALTVDGETIDFTLAYPLEQSDPFPGGHSYTLRISGPKLQKRFAGVSPGVFQSPGIHLTQRVFIDLQFFLNMASHQAGAASGGWKFFLNSIHELSFTADELKLTGECSEVVK